ncbi:hypothetical protein GCM10028805_48940 [Spirosoma harenae]
MLTNKYPEFSSFDEFTVELGNEKANAHDIISKSNSQVLAGEAFNVAPSYFNGKSTSSIKKLLANKSNPDQLIILCNSDSYKFTPQPLIKGGRIRIIPVDVSI